MRHPAFVENYLVHIAEAKARGPLVGRPPKHTPQQQEGARRRRAEGTTLKGLAKSYNVGRATISRLA